MQTKSLLGVALIAAAVSLAACTTRPVSIDTPGPGEVVVPVPVPGTVANEVRASLNTGMGADAEGIDVRADAGTVYLTGRVASRELHDKAVALARGTPNVTAVVHTGLIINN